MSLFVLEYRYVDMDARARARAAHLEYMGRLHASGTVVMGGPLADTDGAMVLLDVLDEAAVQEVVSAHPYTHVGAAADHRIRRWDVVIPAGGGHAGTQAGGS